MGNLVHGRWITFGLFYKGILEKLDHLKKKIKNHHALEEVRSVYVLLICQMIHPALYQAFLSSSFFLCVFSISYICAPDILFISISHLFPPSYSQTHILGPSVTHLIRITIMSFFTIFLF